MKGFKGKLNDKGLSSFNQMLFDNMSCFSDFVWVIDVLNEEAEILFDNISPSMVGKRYSLEELRNSIEKRYVGEANTIIKRYTKEYLSNIKETSFFNNPTFSSNGKKYKLRIAMTPELDDNNNTVRVYITGVNNQIFATSNKEKSEIYKTVSMILSHAKNNDESIKNTLKYLGEALNVSHVYVVENDHHDPRFGSATFEWCAKGIPPQINYLQHFSYAEYGLDYVFSKTQLYTCQDVSGITHQITREIFEAQGVRAFVNYAFYNNDKFAGFIALEDYRTPRNDWDPDSEEMEIFTFVADLLSTFLNKERNLIQALDNKTILQHFVDAYTSAYTVDLKEGTFEILHMSHEFKQIFSMDGSFEDMMRFIEEHVHPDDKEFMKKMTDRYYLRERMKKESEISFMVREVYGKIEKTMHVVVIRGVDADHVVIGFMDVSAELKKEKDLNEKLESANKAKKDFLSSMSHDIRTPMNAIIGMTDIALKHTDDPSRMIDSLQKIRLSSNQLVSLVNDILDISAIESGKIELRPVSYFVKEGLETIRTTCDGILSNRDLKFTVYQHDIIYRSIKIDEMRFNQIVMNLLSNAIKYTPDGGTITLENYQEVKDNQPYNIIVVRDTGIGMSKEFIKKMWDAFMRATDSRINKINGAGLGLAIVKSLVDMMHGTITVDSKLNKGTTFTVTIPIIPEHSNNIVCDLNALKKNELTYKVLIVEDNDMNYEIASELLAVHGITSLRAENGKIALELFKKSTPDSFDAILMDIEMPEMNGLDATRAIRKCRNENAKSIPIIAMTANAFTDDVEACLKAGMNDHLSKPIDINKVIETLKKHIECKGA